VVNLEMEEGVGGPRFEQEALPTAEETQEQQLVGKEQRQTAEDHLGGRPLLPRHRQPKIATTQAPKVVKKVPAVPAVLPPPSTPVVMDNGKVAMGPAVAGRVEDPITTGGVRVSARVGCLRPRRRQPIAKAPEIPVKKVLVMKAPPTPTRRTRQVAMKTTMKASPPKPTGGSTGVNRVTMMKTVARIPVRFPLGGDGEKEQPAVRPNPAPAPKKRICKRVLCRLCPTRACVKDVPNSLLSHVNK